MITQGPGLVFVVFPHALAKMPLPQLWSVVFFGMLVLLGIDSQFATVEVIITSLKVSHKNFDAPIRKQYAMQSTNKLTVLTGF